MYSIVLRERGTHSFNAAEVSLVYVRTDNDNDDDEHGQRDLQDYPSLSNFPLTSQEVGNSFRSGWTSQKSPSATNVLTLLRYQA